MRAKIYISITLAAMLLSCTKAETEISTALPEGKYPLRITAEMTSPQTRSGGKDAWVGGEEIGVIMDGMLSPKKYRVEGNLAVRPADAENIIWWKNTDEARITAWHPDIVNPNLDISDQSRGYAEFDLVWATAGGRYKQDIVLQFRHSMAKVEFSLAAGDGITEEELAGASVKVLGDDEAYFSIGMIGAADKSDGEIAPYYDSETKKFEAVVVPQDMTGKPLIRIGLGGKTFAYTPSTEAAGKLDAGTCHSYAITVKANGLEVQTPWGYDWSAGGEEEVIAKRKFTAYTADEVKTGDYIYTDGTTSDGGLRTRYYDGTAPVFADPKPKPVTGKTVAGIVFWTPADTDPAGRQTPASLTDDKIMAKDFPNCTHGLAVALKDASDDTLVWQDPYESVQNYQNSWYFRPSDKYDYKSISSGRGATDNINRILGYQNTKILYTYSAYCHQNVKYAYTIKPVEEIESFAVKNPAPKGSTGWFLPSLKELHILSYGEVDNVSEVHGKDIYKGRTLEIVERSISDAKGALLLKAINMFFASSTESSESHYVTLQIKNASKNDLQKNMPARVRAVCAF